MAFANTNGVIDNISGYVDENSFDLISKSVLGTNLAQYINVRVGLQGKTVDIPLMESDFVVSDGDACGWSDTETTTITQVTMNLANNKINAKFCAQALRDTFMSKALAAGAMNGGESLPYEEVYANYFVEKLNKWNEDFLIKGDSARSIDGIQDIFAGGTAAAEFGTGGTSAAWTSAAGAANAVTLAQGMYEALPAKVSMRDDLILVVSPQDYKVLQLAVTQGNYYHIAPDSANLYIPGTNVRVVSSSGIDYNSGVSFKFLGPANSVIMGTDLTSDFEEFKLWYSQDNDEIRSLMRWIVGVAITDPSDFVITNKNATQA